MSVFKDSLGQEWRIFLDGFLLADVAKETGVDLADVSAGGWSEIQTDAGLVGRMLAVLCQEEIKARKIESRSFARLIRGTAIDQARAALVAEGADFFPPSEWSAMLSNWEKRKAARTQAETMQAAMAALDGMSPEFRQGAMRELMEVVRTAAREGISSSASLGNESVAGLDLTPLSVVTSEPVKSESAPAA